jgi:hypothetical protein
MKARSKIHKTSAAKVMRLKEGLEQKQKDQLMGDIQDMAKTVEEYFHAKTNTEVSAAKEDASHKWFGNVYVFSSSKKLLDHFIDAVLPMEQQRATNRSILVLIVNYKYTCGSWDHDCFAKSVVMNLGRERGLRHQSSEECNTCLQL